MSRGSRRGLSEFILWGYLTLGFWPWMMVSDNYFCHLIFWMMAAGNIAVDIASIHVFRSLPEWDPETADQPPSAAPVNSSA